MRRLPAPSLVSLFFIISGALVGAFLVRGIVRMLARRLPEGAPLNAAYARLGRTAPGDPCPCSGGTENGAPAYQDCCRARDVAELEDLVREFLFRRWSHKSYAGRRWSRPMKDRLQDYPLPGQVILPRWVRKPEDFEFPISEKLLRKWRPQQQNVPRGVEDEAGCDLPL